MVNSRYGRLIILAEEINTPSTPEKMAELNELLAELSPNDINSEHLSLLDYLISIISNTGNLFVERQAAILKLQNAIRSKS